jgi:DeoR family suf operon transcriptional repressor
MYRNSGARERVVERLRERGPSTVDELSRDLGLVPVTTRSHLAALEAQGLVVWSEDRGRVGRPRRRYSLTAKADALLPHAYATFAADVLDSLRSLAGKRGVDQLLDMAAARQAARQAGGVAGRALPARVAAVADALRAEGGAADWRQEPDRFVIRDLHCPYAELVSERPEMCRYHLQVLTRLLGEPVTLARSIANGEPWCDFVVPPHPGQRASGVRTLSDGRPGPDASNR